MTELVYCSDGRLWRKRVTMTEDALSQRPDSLYCNKTPLHSSMLSCFQVFIQLASKRAVPEGELQHHPRSATTRAPAPARTAAGGLAPGRVSREHS